MRVSWLSRRGRSQSEIWNLRMMLNTKIPRPIRAWFSAESSSMTTMRCSLRKVRAANATRALPSGLWTMGSSKGSMRSLRRGVCPMRFMTQIRMWAAGCTTGRGWLRIYWRSSPSDFTQSRWGACTVHHRSRLSSRSTKWSITLGKLWTQRIKERLFNLRMASRWLFLTVLNLTNLRTRRRKKTLKKSERGRYKSSRPRKSSLKLISDK